MNQRTLDELDRSADEILSKSEKSEELDPEEISEDAEAAEDEDEKEADGGDEESVAEDEDQDEDTDEDDDDEEEDDVKKSLMHEVIDENHVSEEMTAIVEIFAKSLADVMENVTDSRTVTENTSAILAKSLLAQNVILKDQKEDLEKTNQQLNDLNKALTEKLEAIDAKIDAMRTEPAHMRKSVSTYSVTDRNFKGSLQGSDSDAGQKLSKSEMISILNNELYSGSPIVRPEDIVMLESGAPMRSEIAALLNSKSTR